MENNHLPEMTDELRKENLVRAMAARRERFEFKNLMKKGEISLADAIADDRAKRIYVRQFLMSVPYIGEVKAEAIMRELHIAPNRRVQGLGYHQRKGIIELLANK